MQKIKKNILKENHTNISVRRIYQNTQEIIEYWLRKIKLYKIKKFDSVFSTNECSIGKGRLNLRRKNSNWMFKYSIGIFQGLIEFIKDLIARKFNF